MQEYRGRERSMKSPYLRREFNDPFVNNVMSNMTEEMQASFTDKQAEALVTALSKAYNKTNHYVDLRFSIHLFFARYYVVLLMVKDHRERIRNLVLARRKQARVTTTTLLIGTLIVNVFIVMLVLAFCTLYFIKYCVGIDIFSEKHLLDFLF